MRARFGLLWVVVTALVAGVAAWIAYGIGVATKLPAAPAAGAVAPYYYYPHPFFGFFGFLGFLFVLIAIFWLLRIFAFGFGFRRRGWGPGGPGGAHWGPGYHGREERFREWHQREHGQEPAQDKPTEV